jgi:capsular polysaccharide export protein
MITFHTFDCGVGSLSIVLHIGLSKTGTSSLQNVLCQNRETLKKQNILYPDVFLKGMPLHIPNHNSFANALASYKYYPNLSAEEYATQFLRQYDESHATTMILSAESFFGGDPHVWDVTNPMEYWKIHEQKLHNLKKLLGDAEIEVVLYLRRQDQWLDSAIGQIVRYEGTMGKKVYESDRQIMELLFPRMDYVRLIDLWDTIVKPQKFMIAEYNTAHFPQSDICADFFDRIGIDTTLLDMKIKSSDENRSWSKEFIEVKKILNQTPRSRSVERAIIETINRVDIQYGSREPYRVSPDTKRDLMAKTKDGNHAVSLKYMDGKPLFSDDAIKAPQNSAPNIDEKERIAEAMRLFNHEFHSWRGTFSVCKISLNTFARRRFPAIHAGLKWLVKEIKAYRHDKPMR